MSNPRHGQTGYGEVRTKVQSFYEDITFPSYDEAESFATLVQKAEQNLYTRLLDRQIPRRSKILEMGCGTGQFSIFMAMGGREVTAVDISTKSIEKAAALAARLNVGENIKFVRSDLFELPFERASFDYVFSSGVLHHTPDPRGGFRELVSFCKPGGGVGVGLYNTYGRIPLYARKWIFRLTKNRFLWLDHYMRSDMEPHRKRTWFLDQYQNPLESTHTADEVLGWFKENNVRYMNSIPKINLIEQMSDDDQIFAEHDPGSRFDHILCQLGWIFTQGREGGFFLMFGRKQS